MKFGLLAHVVCITVLFRIGEWVTSDKNLDHLSNSEKPCTHFVTEISFEFILIRVGQNVCNGDF